MAEVLLVSKAIAPPWNDSGKNLVRDLARGLTRHRPTVMVTDAALPELAHARLAPVYTKGVAFAPALVDQGRVFAYLLRSRGHALWHFFFAPNPRSCSAGRAAKLLRRRAVLHTLSSAPRDPQAIVPWLFADLNVVLSRHTEQRLLDAGLSSARLRRVPPAIEPLAPKNASETAALRSELGLPNSAPCVVYPGDLEFGNGAALMVELAHRSRLRPCVVLACRTKTSRARAVLRELEERVHTLGLGEQVRFVGETPRIHDYLACADVVALPSADLYAKMDYPLVLLEAMSLARCVVVAQGSAAAELAEHGGARALAPDAEALTDGVDRLLDDDHARALLGQTARRAVVEHYTYDAMARAYEFLYDALI